MSQLFAVAGFCHRGEVALAPPMFSSDRLHIILQVFPQVLLRLITNSRIIIGPTANVLCNCVFPATTHTQLLFSHAPWGRWSAAQQRKVLYVRLIGLAPKERKGNKQCPDVVPSQRNTYTPLPYPHSTTEPGGLCDLMVTWFY